MSSTVVAQDFVKVDKLFLSRLQEPQPDLTFGMETFDELLKLNFGQFIALHGKTANTISMRLCVRAVLPQPLGPDCNVIIIDGGNLFDPYYISDCAVDHDLDAEKVLNRLHISRAFTHHQLARLITDKLSCAIRNFEAKLIVVSDITQLFCDPDVRDSDKEDAFRIFTKTTLTLRRLARQHRCLVIVTNPEPRNVLMEHILTQAVHVSARIQQEKTLTKFTLLKHPYSPPRVALASAPNVRTLESYM